MSKYIRMFFLLLLASGILYIILGSIIKGGDPAEDVTRIFGIILVILLSFLISQIFYLINIVKKKG